MSTVPALREGAREWMPPDPEAPLDMPPRATKSRMRKARSKRGTKGWRTPQERYVEFRHRHAHGAIATPVLPARHTRYALTCAHCAEPCDNRRDLENHTTRTHPLRADVLAVCPPCGAVFDPYTFKLVCQ